MNNEYKDNYVYTIVGDETKAIIKDLEAKAAQKRAEYEAQLKAKGILIKNIGPEGTDLEFTLADGVTEAPKGWTKEFGRGACLWQDWSYQPARGEIDIAAFQKSQKLQDIFNDVCHSLAPCSHNGRKYNFVELGDELIVICPKDMGKAIIPSDAQVISYVDYLKKLEATNPSTPIPTQTFAHKYTP